MCAWPAGKHVDGGDGAEPGGVTLSPHCSCGFSVQKICLVAGPLAGAEADVEVDILRRKRIGPNCRHQPNIEIRMRLRELVEAGCNAGNSVRDGYSCSKPLRRPDPTEQAGGGDGEFAERVVHTGQIRAAVVRQIDTSCVPREQHDPELTLKRADPVTDSGGGQVQLIGGGDETALSGRSLERFEVEERRKW